MGRFLYFFQNYQWIINRHNKTRVPSWNNLYRYGNEFCMLICWNICDSKKITHRCKWKPITQVKQMTVKKNQLSMFITILLERIYNNTVIYSHAILLIPNVHNSRLDIPNNKLKFNYINRTGRFTKHII